ncbi:MULTISPECIES: hypothetical protein [unclassified Microcoleus]|jgi:type IV secretory pathway VirB10-like protein|uniref:hypothetical protein n=1 Tax=unclassified Microcoleus TaxID=2642155 RepID=UPI001D5D624A|nr:MULTISPECIES: hypothetical protein [unclassified Microcoleus]MCC3420769.1 hypothetical protein [Microcoleus sp. PH2017_07_MST_O_A]MCC3431314.1 hypothetical protein [Microcoleus sp. PH2017_04_SCI_O_A]MCC3468230.1 hypothetical protein [Microcoleus sp. PH2017_06_SFM_O_A]MCC3508872.1 hypothetical protein [Microcoleus sp. PH2017_17_BER_D_A]TAE41315.1 MAG: hypothetical protein EAZ90_18445 [Oscillatoriales cyanobacterium]
MYFFRKQIAILFVVVACCTLTISCSGDNRTVQCTKLIAIVTKGNALINFKNGTYDAATSKNLAKDLNQTAKEIEALRITDATLKEIQAPSVKFFGEMGQGIGDMGKALEAGNRASTSIEGREQIKKAKADIVQAGQRANQAAKDQDALTEKLINYCKSDR